MANEDAVARLRHAASEAVALLKSDGSYDSATQTRINEACALLSAALHTTEPRK